MGSWGAPHGEAADGCDAAAAFADALMGFAERRGARHLLPVITRLRRPVSIAVRGRRGVGGSTLRTALEAHGVSLTTDAVADVRVLVAVEALKAEESTAVAHDPATIVVLNKADLCRSLPDGPIAEADRQAAAVQADTGARVVAMSALLAVAGSGPMGDETLAALQVLTRAPADLSAVDAFVDAEHPLSREARVRLLARLDRFGIAHAVTALAGGVDASRLPGLMSELSNEAALLTALRAAAAAVRYRRVRDAVIELRCLADGYGNDALAGAEPVLATMAAAVAVLESDGLRVDPDDRPAAHRNRALHWRAYGPGCVDALHRDCSADVVRGSLRLLHEAVRA